MLQKLLLEKNADPNIKDNDGNTPLHIASKTSEKAVSVLFSNNPKLDPNIQNNYGQTPLHLAVDRCAIEIVNLLLTNKADPNIKDIDGNTPLHIATMFKDYNMYSDYSEIVKALLNKNANINIKNKNGNTPLDEAKNRYTQLEKKNTAKIVLPIIDLLTTKQNCNCNTNSKSKYLKYKHKYLSLKTTINK